VVDVERSEGSSHLLPSGVNREIFANAIVPGFYRNCGVAPIPIAHFFAGQPGAGKTKMEGATIAALEADGGKDSVAIISLDDYRPFHPMHRELLVADEETAGAAINQDCWLWSEQAKEYVIDSHFNVVQEGTFRDPAATLTDAGRYLEAGYSTEFHVAAVHPFISRLRYLTRYVREVELDGYGRLVPRELHDHACQQLPESVATVAEAGMFEAILVHDDRGDIVARVEFDDPDAVTKLMSVISGQRSVEGLDFEGLLDEIEMVMERARVVGRDMAVGELQALREDVLAARAR
jgi:hypothetical protein